MAKSTFALFATQLRALGFVRDYQGTIGGERLASWRKSLVDRTLLVDIWDNNFNYATHAIDGRMPAEPSNFGTVEEMFSAIEIETTRTDNKNFR